GIAGTVVLGSEPSPDHGLNAERRERAFRDGEALHLLRRSEPRDAHSVAVPYTELLKRAILVTKGEVIGGREIQILNGDPRRLLPDADQLLRIGVWQRLQQNAVDDAEDGGVGTDSNSDREYGQKSEHRRAKQSAENAPELLAERSHNASYA